MRLIISFIFAMSWLVSGIVFGSESQVSKDAIAIRVMPNLNHYSPERWYYEQGFKGEPSHKIVDGYEGLQDGNTIYVNAANIVGNKFHTNIYVIAFNVGSEDITIEIFSEILSNIKFNTELEPDELLGECNDNEANICTLDLDCAQQYYCDSGKAKIIRDTKRLADIAEIEIALGRYKQKHGREPELLSGTYLPGATISTWPSWQDTFAPELGFSSLPTDPINKLVCGTIENVEIEQETCWAEKTQQFADKEPHIPTINLKEDSYVYAFVSD